MYDRVERDVDAALELMRLAIAVAALTACGDRAAPEPVAIVADPPVIAVRVAAADLIAKFECNRCHEVPAVAAAPREKHCVACHQEIHAGTFPADASTLSGWQHTIASLRWAPSLAAADRLRRDWVRDFLLTPHDVRPGLVAQMPRLAIERAEAERLAAYLVPSEETVVDVTDAEIARGEQLFLGLACARCHRFTGAAVDDAKIHNAGRAGAKPLESWVLAPDLRHARTRMTSARIAEWIIAPRGAMPVLGIAAADARALAAFISSTPIADLPAPERVARPPRLNRTVTWNEVEARVFRKLCWHCHAQPDYAHGDGGPGNSGGFGFAERGLDLSTYEGIASGSLDDDGEPRSVLAPLADGTPRLVAHLLARYAEEAGQVSEIRGMPLGLPALPLADIQLVDTWITQGRRR